MCEIKGGWEGGIRQRGEGGREVREGGVEGGEGGRGGGRERV